MNKYKELLILDEKVQRLMDEKEVDWETKFDLIFSKHVSRRIFSLFKELNINFDYYDPDGSYEEDVKAFRSALDEKMKDLSKISYMFE